MSAKKVSTCLTCLILIYFSIGILVGNFVGNAKIFISYPNLYVSGPIKRFFDRVQSALSILDAARFDGNTWGEYMYEWINGWI